jgi:DNA-binding transcriptional MerR regulator
MMAVRRRHDGAERRREGSARGAEAVRREFEAALTRRRFSKAVGIHPTTLRRWESAGIVQPKLETILGIPTFIYSEEDVRLGKSIVRILREGTGTVSLEEAATIARRRRQRPSSRRTGPNAD